MEGVEGDEARVLVTEEFSDGEGPPSPGVMEHLKSVVTEIFEDGGLNDPPKPEPEPEFPPDIHHILKSPPSPVITPPEPIEEVTHIYNPNSAILLLVSKVVITN